MYSNNACKDVAKSVVSQILNCAQDPESLLHHHHLLPQLPLLFWNTRQMSYIQLKIL